MGTHSPHPLLYLGTNQKLIIRILSKVNYNIVLLNNKIVTPKDVEEYWEIPLLGVVPYEKPQKEKRLKAKEVGGN